MYFRSPQLSKEDKYEKIVLENHHAITRKIALELEISRNIVCLILVVIFGMRRLFVRVVSIKLDLQTKYCEQVSFYMLNSENFDPTFMEHMTTGKFSDVT